MQIAIVSPVFKTGYAADISNYRPIFVLPSFWMCIVQSSIQILNYKKILHSQQLGFQKIYSSSLSVRLCKTWLSGGGAISNVYWWIGICLKFQKSDVSSLEFS